MTWRAALVLGAHGFGLRGAPAKLPDFREEKWRQPPAEKLAELFIPLGPHDAATDFVLDAPAPPLLNVVLYEALCYLPLNEFDLQAMLYPAASHLLTEQQLLKLFAEIPSKPRILDIGAGDGCVTRHLKAAASSLVATETSFGRAFRLRLNGYEVWREDCKVEYLQMMFLPYRLSVDNLLRLSYIHITYTHMLIIHIYNFQTDLSDSV